MVSTCISGKKVFQSQSIAEDVLIELWAKNDYKKSNAPVTIYKCDDCGYYHLTSHGEMNERLAKYLKSSQHKIDQEASRWADKFKRR